MGEVGVNLLDPGLKYFDGAGVCSMNDEPRKFPTEQMLNDHAAFVCSSHCCNGTEEACAMSQHGERYEGPRVW